VVSGQGIDGINPPSNAAAERTPVAPLAISASRRRR
jgi:hypothetical protein